jgi:hypothetical protein
MFFRHWARAEGAGTRAHQVPRRSQSRANGRSAQLDSPYGFAGVVVVVWVRCRVPLLVCAAASVIADTISNPATANVSKFRIIRSCSWVPGQGADRPAAALAWVPDFGFLAAMDENTGTAQNDPRKERLAKALRDNLRRRKAQARERAAQSQPDETAGKVSECKD